MLQKISICTAAMSAFFLGACSDGSASASGDYVKASANAEKAVKAFDAGDYSEALGLAESAEAQVRGIVEKYPDSDIAFKIVSDEMLRLGSWRYSDFRTKLLPEMRAVADKDMGSFDLAWAVCFGSGGKTDASLVGFGSLAAFYPEQARMLEERGVAVKHKLSLDESKKMASKVSDYIKSADAKVALLRTITSAEELYLKNSSAAKKGPAQAAVPAVAAVNIPIENPEKFLEDARREAVRVVYNMEAPQKLLAMSNAALADKSIQPQFGEILRTALENAQKISSRRLKNPAVSTVISALAKIGFNDDALMGTMYIDGDSSLKTACLERIAHSYAASGNFESALNIIAGFAEGPKKSEMLLRLCMDIARDGDAQKALLIARDIKDAGPHSVGLLMVSGVQWGKNAKDGAEILAEVNPVYLNERNIADFCLAANIATNNYASRDARMVDSLAAVANSFVEFDREKAAHWESAAMRYFQKITEPRELASLSGILSGYMLKAGKKTEALELLLGVANRADPQSMISVLCETGLEVCLRGDEALAENFFANAIAIAKNKQIEQAYVANALYIAWQMQVAGMPRAKSVSMLAEFLPDFK